MTHINANRSLGQRGRAAITGEPGFRGAKAIFSAGGGMTAIGAATQAKGLGADEVTICYRGPRGRMKASPCEREIAQTRGVSIRFHMQPRRLIVSDGRVAGMEFDRNGETVIVECGQIFKAIGQTLDARPLAEGAQPIDLIGGRIRVDAEGRTSLAKVWALVVSLMAPCDEESWKAILPLVAVYPSAEGRLAGRRGDGSNGLGRPSTRSGIATAESKRLSLTRSYRKSRAMATGLSMPTVDHQRLVLTGLFLPRSIRGGTRSASYHSDTTCLPK